ncbi:hypothetical protein K502DRAFT_293511 [Neoconidiobolus thromboides FSU 785]|nr:hypothetical protein K502DRAFT_293511 [Neoconidiobolus thromboides FSU 785]
MFYFITLFLLINVDFALGKLQGAQHVSYHEYFASRSILQTNPVFCEIPIQQLDIEHITAVQGLEFKDCGTCLRVKSVYNSSLVQYVMAIDKGGLGLDLNTFSFKILKNNQLDGLVNVNWEVVNSLYCKDVVTGSFKLPGYISNLRLPYLESKNGGKGNKRVEEIDEYQEKSKYQPVVDTKSTNTIDESQQVEEFDTFDIYD